MARPSTSARDTNRRSVKKDDSSEESNISTTSNILKNLKSAIDENKSQKNGKNPNFGREVPKILGVLSVSTRRMRTSESSAEYNPKRISDYFEENSVVEVKQTQFANMGPNIQLFSFKDSKNKYEDLFKKQKAPKANNFNDVELENFERDLSDFQHHFSKAKLKDDFGKGSSVKHMQMKNHNWNKSPMVEGESALSFFRLSEHIKDNSDFSRNTSYPTLFFEDNPHVSNIGIHPSSNRHKDSVAASIDKQSSKQLVIANSQRKNSETNRLLFTQKDALDPKTQFKNPTNAIAKPREFRKQCSTNEITLKGNSIPLSHDIIVEGDKRPDIKNKMARESVAKDKAEPNLLRRPSLYQKQLVDQNIRPALKASLPENESRVSIKHKNDSLLTKTLKNANLYKIKSSSTFRRGEPSPTNSSIHCTDQGSNTKCLKNKLSIVKSEKSAKKNLKSQVNESRKKSMASDNGKLSLIKHSSVFEKERGKGVGAQTERPEIRFSQRDQLAVPRTAMMTSKDKSERTNLHKKTLSQNLVLNSKIFHSLKKNFRGSMNFARLEGLKQPQPSELNLLDFPRASSIEKRLHSHNPKIMKEMCSTQAVNAYSRSKNTKTINHVQTMVNNESIQDLIEEQKFLKKEAFDSPLKRNLLKQLRTKLSFDNRNGAQKFMPALKKSMQEDPRKQSNGFYNSISHDVEISAAKKVNNMDNADAKRKVSIGKMRRFFPKSEKVIATSNYNGFATSRNEFKLNEHATLREEISNLARQEAEKTLDKDSISNTYRKKQEGLVVSRNENKLLNQAPAFIQLSIPKVMSIKRQFQINGDLQAISSKIIEGVKSSRNSQQRNQNRLMENDDRSEKRQVQASPANEGMKKHSKGSNQAQPRLQKVETINIRKALQLEKQRSMSKKVSEKLMSNPKLPKEILGVETERPKRTIHISLTNGQKYQHA